MHAWELTVVGADKRQGGRRRGPDVVAVNGDAAGGDSLLMDNERHQPVPMTACRTTLQRQGTEETEIDPDLADAWASLIILARQLCVA